LGRWMSQPPHSPEVNPVERAKRMFGDMWREGCMGA